MKRLFALVLILLTVCLIACGCDASAMFPYGNIQIEDKSTQTYQIYVCGAVLNEGYYDVDSCSDYYSAIALAGIVEQTLLPIKSLAIVTIETAQLVVNYIENGIEHDCINVNSALIVERLTVEGISADIVNKIADYVEIFGKITNKAMLATALGSDYEDNFFKFFVAMEDYEEVN